MVYGLMAALFIMLTSFIAFIMGFIFGHMKSQKKIDVTLNLFDAEYQSGEDGDGESLPANVTPIRKDAITND